MTTLGKIWKARKLITEGVVNNIVRDDFVETVSEYRMNICKGCKYYDGKCSVAGSGPCCGACGCSLKFKTRSLASACGAIEKGEDPLWLPVLSQKDETKFHAEYHNELNEKNAGTDTTTD